MSLALRKEVGENTSTFFKAMTNHYRVSEALEKGAVSTNRDLR